MNVTGIALRTPPGAQDNPEVTPELLASCLAKYSRSNKGIDSILASIDWSDPDKSVDSIFRFVDYGHASITGMTGGIAIAIDGLSMFLAYKIFEIAQLSDGQESSTRYIQLDKTNLPDAQSLGIPASLEKEWQDLMESSFDMYHTTYQQLDSKAQQDPSLIRVPEGTSEKVVDRLRRNYALDRSRYLIPFATKTNAAYVMTARVWADTIRQLDSLPLPEAAECAGKIRKELEKFVPRMIKHSFPTEASRAQVLSMLNFATRNINAKGVCIDNIPSEVFLSVHDQMPSFLPLTQKLEDGFMGKVNRYSTTGAAVNRVMLRAAWNNMAIAELRDLNRHRSGHRFSPLLPVGFYSPEEVDRQKILPLLEKKKKLIEKICARSDNASYLYALLLGTQTPFEHSTHLEKFIYEIELRTGLGAHFRYAEHLRDAYQKLIEARPQFKDHIHIGDAEPEF
ncbi:hypothetical protein CHISP_0978 [Chitinispirillum alkaliphilum]|nr:hypothetical protein CHISP_0978 [Chitinispirillum alkaliphilum]